MSLADALKLLDEQGLTSRVRCLGVSDSGVTLELYPVEQRLGPSKFGAAEREKAIEEFKQSLEEMAFAHAS